MVVSLKTILPVPFFTAGIILTCSRGDLELSKRKSKVLAECARLSKEIVALEAMAPSIAGSKRQVEAYRNLAEEITDNHSLGLQFSAITLQSLASMRKMHLDQDNSQGLFCMKELIALELAIVSPSNKSGIVNSIKAIKKELLEEPSIGISMIKNLVEQPKYDIILLKLIILVLEIHKLLEPSQGKKLAQLIPTIMYAHPDPVLNDFETLKASYEGLIQKYTCMLKDAAPHVDFFLKLNLPNFPQYMDKEFLWSSFLGRLVHSNVKNVNMVKLLCALELLNLVGDGHKHRFLYILCKMPDFVAARKNPVVRFKLVQKLAPNEREGELGQILAPYQKPYDELTSRLRKPKQILLDNENIRWLQGNRSHKQYMLEGLSHPNIGSYGCITLASTPANTKPDDASSDSPSDKTLNHQSSLALQAVIRSKSANRLDEVHGASIQPEDTVSTISTPLSQGVEPQELSGPGWSSNGYHAMPSSEDVPEDTKLIESERSETVKPDF